MIKKRIIFSFYVIIYLGDTMVELVRQNFKTNKKIYNETKHNLRKKLDKSISIEHVGSTAIPNMYGKNIIDIPIYNVILNAKSSNKN